MFKKIMTGLLVGVIALALMSVTVSAKTYYGSFEDYVLSADTPTEVGAIADGLRQYINDATAENAGCKVTFYYKQRGFADTFSEPLIRLNVNVSAIGYLQQTVPLEGNAVTFDWDVVLARENWNQRLGYIREITLTSGTEIVLTGVAIYVPEAQELAAGAPAEDTAEAISWSR